jgi:catechol 2,3-dioxygenase-like lactoylglutathione lyase family enzyme
MAKIRYIAIMATDPQRLSQFYRKVFGMTELHRTKSGNIYLTDGYLNLGLIRNKTNLRNGFDRIGFEVDCIEDTGKLLSDNGVPAPQQPTPTTPFDEARGYDPEGNPFHMSIKGYDAPSVPETEE